MTRCATGMLAGGGEGWVQPALRAPDAPHYKYRFALCSGLSAVANVGAAISLAHSINLKPTWQGKIPVVPGGQRPSGLG